MGEKSCPKCKGTETTKSGFVIRRTGRVQSYRCICGHRFIEKATDKPKTTEQRPEEHKKKSLIEQGTKIGAD